MNSMVAKNLGLVNKNGNDCFFSAAFQCLSEITPFIDFLTKNEDFRQAKDLTLYGGLVQHEFYRFTNALQGKKIDAKYESKIKDYYKNLGFTYWSPGVSYNPKQNATRYFRDFITNNNITQNWFLSEMRSRQQDAREFFGHFLDTLLNQTPYHQQIINQIKSLKLTTIQKNLFKFFQIFRTELPTINLINYQQAIPYAKEELAVLWKNKKFIDMLTKLQKLHAIFNIKLTTILKEKNNPSHKSITTSPEFSLLLEITEKTRTMKACLNNFFSPEELSSLEWWRCHTCSKKVASTKQYHLKQLPTILTVALKRFKLPPGKTNISEAEKISTPIRFTKKLKLKKKWFYRASNFNIIYDLFGIICHSGGSNGGHYTAFVKDNQNKWYYYDDSSVSDAQETIEEVAKSGTYGNFTPYLFLYKIDKKSEKQRKEFNIKKKIPTKIKKLPVVSVLEVLKKKLLKLARKLTPKTIIRPKDAIKKTVLSRQQAEEFITEIIYAINRKSLKEDYLYPWLITQHVLKLYNFLAQKQTINKYNKETLIKTAKTFFGERLKEIDISKL